MKSFIGLNTERVIVPHYPDCNYPMTKGVVYCENDEKFSECIYASFDDVLTLTESGLSFDDTVITDEVIYIKSSKFCTTYILIKDLNKFIDILDNNIYRRENIFDSLQNYLGDSLYDKFFVYFKSKTDNSLYVLMGKFSGVKVDRERFGQVNIFPECKEQENKFKFDTTISVLINRLFNFSFYNIRLFLRGNYDLTRAFYALNFNKPYSLTIEEQFYNYKYDEYSGNFYKSRNNTYIHIKCKEMCMRSSLESFSIAGNVKVIDAESMFNNSIISGIVMLKSQNFKENENFAYMFEMTDAHVICEDCALINAVNITKAFYNIRNFDIISDDHNYYLDLSNIKLYNNFLRTRDNTKLKSLFKNAPMDILDNIQNVDIIVIGGLDEIKKIFRQKEYSYEKCMKVLNKHNDMLYLSSEYSEYVDRKHPLDFDFVELLTQLGD